MKKVLNFDMDGTLANLYGVTNWLPRIKSYDPSPYEEARPRLRLCDLARQLNRLHDNGYQINIISWLSKFSTREYDALVIRTKYEWITRHLPSVTFNRIMIVPYGTPKHLLADGYLFDDEERNRAEWGEGAHDPSEILTILKGL